jgi:C_GCAxxG_C_C family probable redox protein
MTTDEIEKRAFGHFDSGFCCAESILKAIMEAHADRLPDDLPKAATGFVGGIGVSMQETCGALTGGIIALGYLIGRTDPAADNEEIKRLALVYRERFLAEFSSTNCGKLLELLGEQEDDAKCKAMTARAAGILSELLEERK